MSKPRRAAVKASSTNFVTVACKVPNGLFLQNFSFRDVPEQIAGGGQRLVKRSFPDGAAIKVHGPARPHGEAPRVPIVMGFALTKGVSAEHWERWLEANKDSAVVKNGLIFANPDSDSVREEARDNREQFSGLERLNPTKDYRNPGKDHGLKVETAKESSKPQEIEEELVEEE